MNLFLKRKQIEDLSSMFNLMLLIDFKFNPYFCYYIFTRLMYINYNYTYFIKDLDIGQIILVH